MRITVIGGTEFIGAAVVEELVARGHELLVIHRGRHEPADLPPAEHAHCDRNDVTSLRDALRIFRPEAVVHTCAYSRADAEAFAQALPGGARAVVLSSMDVYRAYDAAMRGEATDPVPLAETSPVREQRYPYRGKHLPGMRSGVDPETYEKLDVEDVARSLGACVLRLPVVYGERDPLRREDFILRRLRAGRRRIPFGGGTLLWSRAWVRDVAVAIRLSAENANSSGQVLNVCESKTWTMEQWAREVLRAAGSAAELVRVPDAALPPDLAISASIRQQMLCDASKARALLGWRDSDLREALAASVRWHLAHPPSDEDGDLSADDRALEQA